MVIPRCSGVEARHGCEKAERRRAVVHAVECKGQTQSHTSVPYVNGTLDIRTGAELVSDECRCTRAERQNSGEIAAEKAK